MQRRWDSKRQIQEYLYESGLASGPGGDKNHKAIQWAKDNLNEAEWQMLYGGRVIPE